MHLKRNFGSFSQGRPGPMLICLAGIHGNEWAGVNALDLMLRMLEIEPITNPNFEFKGELVALLGNLPALRSKKRFIDHDLNRLWSREIMAKEEILPDLGIREVPELLKLKNAIEEHIDRFKGDKIVLLDLHTTTATGGIFTLPTKDPRSLAIAETMHAPVITGVIERLRGTCIQYFVKKYPAKVIGLVFEAGQHEDPLSVNRTIAAITNCMRSIGMVDPRYIENRHDELLIEYSKNLPEIARLLYIHNVSPQDEFAMEPGYQNFQSVERGEMLAKDKRGPIFAQKQGLILMPLYQNQGEDGYFLIEPTNNKQDH